MENLSMTLVIIIITTIVSVSAFSNEKLRNDLLFWPPAVNKQYQYYRFITSGLVHANWAHLLFNMLTLYSFGEVMELFFMLKINKMGFLLFYIGGLIASEIPTYIKHIHDYNYRSLGASGGVTAVLFSFILLAPWQTLYVFFLPLPAIVFAVLYLSYTAYMSNKGGDHINHSAHLWGAIYGVGVTIILAPESLPHFIQQITHPVLNF
jgi:membrane associated rhomboid family serine protease